MKSIYKCEKELEISQLKPFPAKVLLSKAETPSVSAKIGTLQAGQEVPVHKHDDAIQLEFYLEGRATLYVEDLGEIEVEPGGFLFIPKGVKHGVSKVKEDLKVIIVFIPAIF